MTLLEELQAEEQKLRGIKADPEEIRGLKRKLSRNKRPNDEDDIE